MFLKGGEQALSTRGDIARNRAKEIERLRRTIKEISMANDILRKVSREQRDKDAGGFMKTGRHADTSKYLVEFRFHGLAKKKIREYRRSYQENLAQI